MQRRSMPTHRSGRAWLIGIGLAVGLILGAGGSGLSAANAGTATTSHNFFKICDGTAADGTSVPHGLCAVASCFVLNNLAYCECDVASGDSISLPFKFDSEQDICTVNAAGVGNGYMASTFSFPPRSAQARIRRSTRARRSSRMEPTPSATAGSVSPVRNRFRVLASRRGALSALARSHRLPRRGWATRSPAPTPARNRSSRTAAARPPTRTRARRSIPVPRLAQPPT